MNDQALIIFAQNMIRNNQNRIPNTPWAQAAVKAIMDNNPTAGAEIADNLCQSYGTSREEALKLASQNLKVPF